MTVTPVITVYIPLIERADGGVAATATATEPPSANLQIIDVLADPDGDNPLEEYVTLQNLGTVAVDLTGHTLEDDATNPNTYTFPDGFILQPNATVRVWTISGTNTIDDLYWGRGSGVWNNNGDTATLRDGSGTIIDQFTYPVTTPTVTPTPSPTTDPTAPDVEIVTILYDPQDDPLREFVEIRNNEATAVEMTGWTLEDGATNPATFTFPDGFTLQPQMMVRVWTISGTNTIDNLYWGRGSGVWNNNEDTGILRDGDGTVIDIYTYPSESDPTPQPTNTATPIPTANPNAPQVEISNLLADPDDNPLEEYVDIQNLDTVDITMTGWTLRDSADNTFTFPDGFTLQPQMMVRVWTISGTNTIDNLYWGRGSGVWNNTADVAILTDNNGGVIDTYSYSNVTPTATPTVVGTPVPTATSDPNAANVQVERIEFDPTDVNDADGEYVDITNNGSVAVDMTSWTLSDAANNPNTYTFPTFTLAAQATVRVWVREGTDSDTALYWGRGSGVWNNSGDTATLRDAGEVLVDSCSYGSGADSPVSCG